MKKITLLFLISSFSIFSFAQQVSPSVVNCSGNSFSTSSAKLVYSIGEVAITKIGNSNNSITQGFLQPKITTTSVNETSTSFRFVAYPNPTNGTVIIESESYKEPISVQLIDCMGRVVYNGKLTNNTLSLESYQNGIYLLQILNQKQDIIEHKTITKFN